MKTTLKTREDIIELVEGEDFLKIMEQKAVAIQVQKNYGDKPTVITGTPYIEMGAKGRTFGIEAEGYGKIEIYSYKFNNLTLSTINMVVFPF